MLQEIRVGAQPIERFREIVGEEALEDATRYGVHMRQLLTRRVVWNLNSTGVGGGVAEMLQSLLGYTRALGIDTRWLVIAGSKDFFRLTKRLHHALHGELGDGSPLGDAERALYEDTLQQNAAELAAMVSPGDIVILHDPQTAGLAPALENAGVHLIWRCHIGTERANAETKCGWDFLRPYLDKIPSYVFSRKEYVPADCDHSKDVIIQPSIDPFSAKNQDLSSEATRTILVHTGLIEGPPPANPDHGFVRDDGSPGRVERVADVMRCGRAPRWETPLVVQVSRWDPLKDMVGVMRGFEQLVERGGADDAHLVLAGPNVNAVADDPEGASVFADVVGAWRSLPHGTRQRVHLASLPTADVQENAAIVNALQRHAAVVVQKSLREGFGLTVTEAMWKSRPVVASRIGGIQDQIVHGESGFLLDDPRDLDTFAEALQAILQDPERAAEIGANARERARRYFLGLDHLQKYARLFEDLLARDGGAR